MDKFTKVRNIGKGNMGACVLARNNEDDKYYVIKQVDLTRMNKKERQQSLNEARVLSLLRHPNIINYVDSFLAKKSDHLCIVMEYADGGDINSRIKKNYGVNFRESQVLDWFIQLVFSLHYVHQRKILHRDVKTQNVFLTNDNVVKLGDFGIARTLSNTYDQAKTFVGTPYYLSPELILERPYDHRSDVWALGVVLYEMLTLKHPFNATDMKGLMQRILKVQYDPIPTIYSAEMRSVVSHLLVKDPAQRIELADVLKLPLVRRRLAEWLQGDDVVPPKYMAALKKLDLLPNATVKGPKAHTQHSDRPRQRTTSEAHSSRSIADESGDTCSDDDDSTHLPPMSDYSERRALTSPLTGTPASGASSLTPPSTARAAYAVHGNQDGSSAGAQYARKHYRESEQGVRRPIRDPSYKYTKVAGVSVGATPAMYNGRHYKTPYTSAPRASPVPSRLSSLDNFYEQLSHYQKQRGIGGAANWSAVPGQATPSIRSQASVGSSAVVPPVHIPATVLNSRRASRKWLEGSPSPKSGRANQLNYACKPVSYYTPSLPQHSAAGNVPRPPDIKAMLQRAAQERAERRIGGVS